MGAGPAGPAPLRVIAPGEAVRTPPVHIGPVRGDIDAIVSEWHSHLRRSVLPRRPAGKEMYTIAGRVVEHPGDWILREIDIAADMGSEAFMVDAGWYGDHGRSTDWHDNRGDWEEGSMLPGGGVSAVRDYAHGKGLLFGLWMEAEAISSNSKLYAAHPDWAVTYDGDSTRSVNAQWQGVLNLAKPEVAAFFKQSVLGVIGGKGLDFFKLDYNMSIHEGGRYDVDGYAENQAWRHFECLYDTFETVLERFPGVALENCASGGGRNDLGMLSRFHYAAQSDFSIFPFAIRAINGLTLYLPPESLCYYHNHMYFADQAADLDTHLRVALFCSPIFVGYGGQGADYTTPYFQKTRGYTELIKTFCRPIMAQAAVFHHTPYIGLVEPAEWCVLEYAAQDRSCGYAGLFRLGGDPGHDEYILRLRGIDPGNTYEVTLSNTGAKVRMPGQSLSIGGLPVRLAAVNSSELVLYKKIPE